MTHSKRLIKYITAFIFIFLCLLITPQFSIADTTIYGANAYGFTDMVEINLTQETSQKVGNIAFETQAIDQDPQTGYVYYLEQSTGDEFAYWDPTTGTNTVVRTYDPAPGIYAKQMAFAPNGMLYLITNQDGLYSIDKDTGDLSWLGQIVGLEIGPYGRTGDMAFAPDGRLFVFTYASLYIVDIDTLMATLLYTDMLGGEGPVVWTGAAYCDGLLYASNAEQLTGLSAIFSIDPDSGEVNRLFYTQTLLNDLSSCPANGIPPVNQPPELDPIGAKTVEEGGLLEFTVTAIDPDGDNIAYTAGNLPPGATFDPATQVFSWMPAYGQTGVYPNVLFTVTDDGDPAASDSETITIEVFAMPVPTVTLTTPAAGATFMAPAEITITADASVPGGTVAEVSFYANETLIGKDSTDPYSVTWSDVLEGSYSLTAIAMDSFGAETTSNPVTITVSNTPTDLVVFADSFETGLGEWVQDAQNDWFRSTQRALDGTYAAEVDGRATDAQLISVPIDLQGRTEATITYSWYIESGLDTGEYLAFDVSTDGGLTWVEEARLRGNADQENVWHDVIVELTDIVSLTLRFRGKMSLSSEDANIDGVTVTATWSGPAIDDPPIVSITEPLNGSEITGSVMISADAIDDTGISKVDFYVDDNLVDSDDVTPYEILWDTTTVSNGAHTIQVTAVDTASLTSSDSVNVTINNVMIDANFDSGSLQSYNVEGNTVNIVLNSESMDNNEDDYTYWVNFKVFNALNKDLTFNITGIDVVPFLAYQGTEENQMVYSCDGEIWNRLTQHGYSTDNGGTYTFTETFLCDEVQIATFFPFSYQRMHAYVDTVSSSPWASKTVLGLSSQGREIDLLTITNPAISGGDKEEIYIIGRQHAAETASSHMLKGMIDILISDDDDASAMRDHFVWYVVPMVNPDGVYEGNSRATSELRDLNRDWGNVESDEINTVRGNIELIDNPDDGIDMFIDWHNQMNDVGWYNFVYSPPGNTFFTDLSNWTDFDQEKSLTTSCTDESCSVRGYATDRGLFTFVLEPTPHLSTWTIESLKQQGINTTYAIAEYFDALPDIYPPMPDPMTWATAPNATGTTSISMTATTASDPSGVEYYFMCTAGGGHDSGWQDSATYEDNGLVAATQYTYQVQARDKSANNMTGWSSTLSAATEAPPDTAPPMPDPMTWATAPNATGATSISMTATTASDPSGVEYYFDETSGNSGGSDSGWQDSATYVDTGLVAETQYTYRVQARDKSAIPNMTVWSSTLSATTDEATKSGCGAAPMYRDGGQTRVSATTSSGNALLPLLPSMMALGLWGVRRAGGRRKIR